MLDRAEAWLNLEKLRDAPATPVLLLAVGPLAQRAGWAADAAIAIAEDFAARGQRIVLVDLSLETPVLHERLGTGSTEGLTDVFLFGASREHVTQMLPAHAFELIPASAYTPDAGEILTHRRWSMLFEECAASQTRLLLYLPVELPGAKSLSDRVGETVLLADEWEQESTRNELSQDAHFLATFSPPQPALESPIENAEETGPRSEPRTGPGPGPVTGPVPVPGSGSRSRSSPGLGTGTDELGDADEHQPVPVPVPGPEPAAGPRPGPGPGPGDRLTDEEFDKIRVPKERAREALIADLRARQRAALMAPPPSMAPLSDAETGAARPRVPPPLKVSSGFPPPKNTGIHEPTFASKVREKPPRASKVVPLLIVLFLVSSAAAGWHYWSGRIAPGAATTNAQGPQGPQGSQSPQGPQGAEAATPLPFSVAVATYQVLALAQERVDELHDDEQNGRFYIAPTVVQGSLFYRVLAGPLPDSASAVALRDTLIARRIKTISAASDVVETPFAFLLGTYDSQTDAETRAQDVARMNIPSYIVPISTTGGAIKYALYAGAYSGRGDAEFMRGILQGASLPDTLVERTGSIRS